MKDKKNIKGLIITVIVVGLLSLIPYFINKDNTKEKLVKKDENFKIGKLEYKIPEGFKAYPSYSDDEYKHYSYGENDVYCYIELTKVNNSSDIYKDNEDYLRKTVTFTLNDEVETNKEDEWFTVTVTNKTRSFIGKSSAITEDKTIYVLSYRITDYTHGETPNDKDYKKCVNAYNDVLKSIKINK